MAGEMRAARSSGELLAELESYADPKYLEGMQKFGIRPGKALGVRVPAIRRIAAGTTPDREVALELWNTGIHETMILSTMLFPPELLDYATADSMVGQIATWDLCDHFTGNLVANAGNVVETARAWHEDCREFARRAAFSLMAQADPALYYTEKGVEIFLSFIRNASTDDRNFVRKAVSWALRSIGKSSRKNHHIAVGEARKLLESGNRNARWIGRDALRELESPAAISRLNSRDRESKNGSI